MLLKHIVLNVVDSGVQMMMKAGLAVTIVTNGTTYSAQINLAWSCQLCD